MTGPQSGVTSIAIQTVSGSSVSIGGIAGGAANVSVTAAGSANSLTFNGAVATSGTVAFAGFNTIVDASGALTGSTVSFTGTGTGTGTGSFNDTIHVTGNLAIAGFTTVDLEDNVSATGAVTVPV